MYQYIEKVNMFKINTLFDARRLLSAALAAVLATSALAACGGSNTPAAGDIHLIKHVVVIMQENRSFDSYFGTYPGADGIPMKNGVPSVCEPDPLGRTCVAPFIDHADVNGGGPHGQLNAAADVDGGKMDGFIAQDRAAVGCTAPTHPECRNAATPDVMGYHAWSDIPNYWTYAEEFVLQDHMYEPNASWSLPEHLFQVSEWSAHCTQNNNSASCTNALQDPGNPPDFGPPPHTTP